MFNNSSIVINCVHCHKQILKINSTACERCKLVVYCSFECKKEDWENTINIDYAHKLWCAKLVQYAIEESNFCQRFPFTFTNETTAPTFDEQAKANFLMRYGVFGHGMWRRECLLWLSPLSLEPMPVPGELCDEIDPYVLPQEGALLDEEPAVITDPKNKPLLSWNEYYAFRGFSLESPISVLLQWPLTIYHLITNLLLQDYPLIYQRVWESRRFTLHLIGVEREVELVHTFQEISNLLPQLELNIIMVGREIATGLNFRSIQYKNVHITQLRGSYHQLKAIEDLAAPDVILGFNAGLSAYLTWPPTLKYLALKFRHVPAYFTDYCRYSCEVSSIVVNRLDVGSISTIRSNPFCSPLRQLCDEHQLACFSNAFFFHLIYN